MKAGLIGFIILVIFVKYIFYSARMAEQNSYAAAHQFRSYPSGDQVRSYPSGQETMRHHDYDAATIAHSVIPGESIHEVQSRFGDFDPHGGESEEGTYFYDYPNGDYAVFHTDDQLNVTMTGAFDKNGAELMPH